MKDGANTCNHEHTVQCGYVSPTSGQPVTMTLCDDCAAMVWAGMSQPLRETFWIKGIVHAPDSASQREVA